MIAAALASAARYDVAARVAYDPRGAPGELAAASVAVNGMVLLEAYRFDHQAHWIERATAAAESLIAHADMNHDGKSGWGRYWSRDGSSAGGAAAFSRGCKMRPNAAYDDEMYDDARVLHFLLEMYRTTKVDRYLAAAKAAIDDTWDDGETTFAGRGFAYFKTSGECDRGWHVKNINALMALPLAILAGSASDPRYRRRAEQLVFGELAEVGRPEDGTPANLGYFARDMTSAKADRGKYVSAAQVVLAGGEVVCNPQTRAGESCRKHLGVEARSLYLAMTELSAPTRERDLAVAKLTDAYGRGNACAAGASDEDRRGCIAYLCAVRAITPAYRQTCGDLVGARPVLSQESILGVLWGASGSPGRLLRP